MAEKGAMGGRRLVQGSTVAAPDKQPAAAASPDDGAPRQPAAPAPVWKKVLAGLLLLPLLYAIRSWVVQPLATAMGQALVAQLGPSAAAASASSAGAGDAAAAATADGLHSLVRREVEKGTGEFAAFAALIPILVLLSGIFAGLTLGYMSLDMTQLVILTTSGTPIQQKHAKAIIPVRSNGHQLLVTLLLWNIIIVFAEIIPQSICTRYGLLVGAKAAPLTKFLILVMYPVAWPVSLLLEYILGRHNGIVYRKQELRELLNLHASAGRHGGDLQDGTITMAQGALDLQDKVVRDSMTPAADVFMLPDTAKLDYEVLVKVVQSGHSRVPVYKEVDVPDLLNAGKTRRIKKILGILLVKNCVLLDPEDATPIMSIPLNTHFPTVPQDEPLLNMLAVFREGGSHMAVISRKTRQPATPAADTADAESIIGSAAIGLRERIRRKLAGSDTSDSSDGEDDVELGEVRSKKAAKREEQARKDEQERKRLQKEGQGVPGDAQVAPAAVTKLMDDLENETLGIITLEDIVEDLLQAEIEDEHDKHDAEGNVGAYIPAEAAEIIAKANEDRLRAAAGKSASTPVTSSANTPAAGEKPTKSKTALLKLGALGGLNMRRASSAPGRKRTADGQVDPESFAPAPLSAAAATTTTPPTPAAGAVDSTVDAGAQTPLKDIHEGEKTTFPPAAAGPAGPSPVAGDAPSPPTPTIVIKSTASPLTEALGRGRNKTVASSVGDAAGNCAAAGRSPSAPNSGAATPVTGTSGSSVPKKKVFKSNPVAPPKLQHASTFSGGSTFTEEPKKL